MIKFGNIFKIIIKKCFIECDWNIAYKNKNSQEPNYIALKKKSDRWYADPFIVDDKDKSYIFCELYLKKDELGCIAVCELKNNIITCEPQIIIKNKYHMSYPCVFSWKDAWYMIPETSEKETMELYKAINFPYQWKLDTILCENIKLVDSTVFIQNQKIYIISYNEEKKYNISIFELDMIKKQIFHIFDKHIVSNTGRSAGQIYIKDNNIIRPSQDCQETYGSNVIFNKIVSKDFMKYEEKSIEKLDKKNILINKDEKVQKIHTINSSSTYSVIDYGQEYFFLFKRLFIFRRKIMRKIRVYQRNKDKNL